MCLWVSCKKKICKNCFFFTSLKSLKKGVGSISQRSGSGVPDPDPHKNVTDPPKLHERISYQPTPKVTSR